MKTITTRSLFRFSCFAAALALAPLAASAKDSAAQLLTANGYVTVKAAGPYVELGTYQIQVSTKLGRPSTRLADGSWLYSHFTVNDSQAAGTLLVRFTEGRVSELALLTPATVVALQEATKRPSSTLLVAAQSQR